jgi:hypothetical protein
MSEENDRSRSRLERLSFNGDEETIEEVDELLAGAGLSKADVLARSLSVNAQEFDRLDQQNERHEYRRGALLQQIERRHAGWARQVKRASENVIDAEYTEPTPNIIGRADKS